MRIVKRTARSWEPTIGRAQFAVDDGRPPIPCLSQNETFCSHSWFALISGPLWGGTSGLSACVAQLRLKCLPNSRCIRRALPPLEEGRVGVTATTVACIHAADAMKARESAQHAAKRSRHYL